MTRLTMLVASILAMLAFVGGFVTLLLGYDQSVAVPVTLAGGTVSG
ncbi:hypothetical protein [Streptacidiphilus pinicola]|nr:hypothetical protein [Streptacidiphilus pinicola]